MASDILIVRKETRCRHIGYSYRLTARVLLYAPSHRQDNAYHGLCYTSRGALARWDGRLKHCTTEMITPLGHTTTIKNPHTHQKNQAITTKQTTTTNNNKNPTKNPNNNQKKKRKIERNNNRKQKNTQIQKIK